MFKPTTSVSFLHYVRIDVPFFMITSLNYCVNNQTK